MDIKPFTSPGLNVSVKQHLRAFLRHSNTELPISNLYHLVMNEIEKILIEEVLIFSQGNKKKAAEILGINRNTLHKKTLTLGITNNEVDEDQ